MRTLILVFLFSLSALAKIPDANTAFTKSQAASKVNLEQTKAQYLAEVENSINEAIKSGQLSTTVKDLDVKEALQVVLAELDKNGYNYKYFESYNLDRSQLDISWGKK